MVQIEYPQFVSPEKYDEYLHKGWFRSSFMMYKSEILCINSGLSSIVNIRIDLEKFIPKKRHRKIIRKNDSRFEVSIQSLNISFEADQLYQQQKQKFQGFIHNNLKDYLFATMEMVPYNTKQLEVRFEGKLIALSIIDIGLSSIASILGLYDLNFKEYSLGNYTMLKEMEFAKDSGLKWYYPGYILDQESSFNYKLKFSECQYMNEDSEWLPFSAYDPQACKAHKIRMKTQEIMDSLQPLNMDIKQWYYPYFSFGYLSSNVDSQFLNKALFIEIDHDGFGKRILSYDIQDDLFYLENIWPYPEPERFMNIDPSQEYLVDDNCYMKLSESETIDADRVLAKLIQRNI